MQSSKVQKLAINYKTREDFDRFSEFGLAELSMLDDLQSSIVEDSSHHSPFYGIYQEGMLVARVSLYRVDAKYDLYFDPPQVYHELYKLEVLPQFQNKGYGKQLIDFAKSIGLPIKTNARKRSDQYWLKMGFIPSYDPLRDRGESPYFWIPPNTHITLRK